MRKFKKHPIVKQIVRDFKAKLAARRFFYEDQGKKLDEMFERAEMDEIYRDKILGIFFSRR
ncbi:MAG TPA: hypothetical protein ENH75_07860 [archaeon]|nr:hypothetical protein [archaeon]